MNKIEINATRSSVHISADGVIAITVLAVVMLGILGGGAYYFFG